MLSWGAGPASALFDVHVQLFTAVHTAVHVTGAGGGVFSNMWGWGGDHNLTDNSDMTPRLRPEAHWLGGISGLRIDSIGVCSTHPNPLSSCTVGCL